MALQAKIRECGWLEGALRKRTKDLNERVKELECLCAITASLTGKDSIDQKLDFIVREMPYGWQHPKARCTRIILGERDYKSPRFQQSSLKQSAPIGKEELQIGMLEVYLLPEPVPDDEKPFLYEEQRLLDKVALWLGELAGPEKTTG